MRIRNVIIFSTLIFGLLITGCKSHKSNVSGEYTSSEATESLSPEDAVGALADSYVEWKSISVPVNVTLSQPMSLSASGTLKMVSDEFVHVSLRVFGFEVASLYADKSDLIVLVKVNKMAYTESMNTFTAASGLTLSDIQQLILGQMFYPSKGVLTRNDVKKFNIEEQDDWLVLSPKKSNKYADWNYLLMWADTTTASQLKSLQIDLKKDRKIAASFGATYTSPAGPVSEDISIQTSGISPQVTFSMKLRQDRSSWNEDLSVEKPNIPSNYIKVTTEQMVNFLRSM